MLATLLTVAAAWMLTACGSTPTTSSPFGEPVQPSPTDVWQAPPLTARHIQAAPQPTPDRDSDLPNELSPQEHYRPAPPPSPHKSAKELVAKAAELLNEGRVDEALVALDEAIAQNPDMELLQLAAGDIHRKRGDYEKAASMYERATQTNPASFEAHYFLGLMKQLLGKHREAVSAYLFALAIEPDSFNANHHLASVYIQVGRPAEAVHYARKATQLKRRSQGAWANLAVCYSLMRLYEKAVDAYREAAELGDLADPILLGLADAHIKLDRFERAISVLKTQVRRSPSSIAHERLGYAQYKSKRYEDAVSNFRASLLYDPNYTAALNGLGVSMMTAYIQTERRTPAHRDEAMALWQRSVQLKPGQPKIVRLIEQFQLW